MSQLSNSCPICDAQITVNNDVEVSEILMCPDCRTRIVVENIENNQIVFAAAPEVEEDWGQ